MAYDAVEDGGACQEAVLPDNVARSMLKAKPCFFALFSQLRSKLQELVFSTTPIVAPRSQSLLVFFVSAGGSGDLHNSTARSNHAFDLRCNHLCAPV